MTMQNAIRTYLRLFWETGEIWPPKQRSAQLAILRHNLECLAKTSTRLSHALRLLASEGYSVADALSQKRGVFTIDARKLRRT